MCYAVSEARDVGLARSFGPVTAQILLGLVPPEPRGLPVLLVAYDTVVPKFGREFERAKVPYDHSAPRGREHVNARCFVTLVMCVPVAKDRDGGIVWLKVP